MRPLLFSVILAVFSASLMGCGAVSKYSFGVDDEQGQLNDTGSSNPVSGSGPGTSPVSGNPTSGGSPTPPVAGPTPPPAGIITATADSYAESAGSLYSFELATGMPTYLCSFKMANGGTAPPITDIAINTSGLMYGVSTGALYYVNLENCSLTQAWSFSSSFGEVDGLTALSDGRLVVGGSGLTILDLAAGTVEKLHLVNSSGAAMADPTTSGDIIALPDGYLYWTVLGNGPDELLRVDPNTGVTTDIGSLGYSYVFGLGYASGILYGFADSGAYFQINPANAATSNAGNDGVQWWGATTNPVTW